MSIEKITLQEKKLIEFIRHVGWGEVKLRVCEGEPVLIYEAIRTHKLEKQQKKKSSRKANKTRVWRAQ